MLESKETHLIEVEINVKRFKEREAHEDDRKFLRERKKGRG